MGVVSVPLSGATPILATSALPVSAGPIRDESSVNLEEHLGGPVADLCRHPRRRLPPTNAFEAELCSSKKPASPHLDLATGGQPPGRQPRSSAVRARASPAP